MSTTIVTRENENSSIEKLGAQKEIYSFAKNIFYLHTFIVFISITLLSFAQLMFSKVDFTLVIATVSVVVVIADNLFEHYINKLKERASKIQESFDTYVLNIKWNSILCRNKPEYDEICKYYNKHKSTQDNSKLVNWYEIEIEDVSEIAAKIICQKSNCTYDSSIRKKYNGVIFTIGITTILLILTLTIFSDITLSKIVLTFLFPAVPIIQWTHKNIISNNDSINNLEQLNSLINSTWDNFKRGIIPEENIIRQIQDGLYLNRKGSPLIPDKVYYKLRDKLEERIHYTVKELVREIKDHETNIN